MLTLWSNKNEANFQGWPILLKDKNRHIMVVKQLLGYRLISVQDKAVALWNFGFFDQKQRSWV